MALSFQKQHEDLTARAEAAKNSDTLTERQNDFADWALQSLWNAQPFLANDNYKSECRKHLKAARQYVECAEQR